MNKVNSVCFDPENYGDKDDMWYNVLDLIKTLARNNYIMVVKEEDFGLTYVDFESANKELGGPYPFWLSPAEEERLIYDDDFERIVDKLNEIPN